MKLKSSSLKEYPILSKSADLLIKDFESPGNMLAFLSETMSWFFVMKDSDRRDDNLYFRSMINDVVQPWLKKDISQMIDGLETVYGIGHCAGFEKGIQSLLFGYANEMTSLEYGAEEAQSLMKGINTMIKLSHHFKEYELYLNSQDN